MEVRMVKSKPKLKPKLLMFDQNNMISIPGCPKEPVVYPGQSDQVLALGGQTKTTSISRVSPKHANSDPDSNNKQNSGVT